MTTPDARKREMSAAAATLHGKLVEARDEQYRSSETGSSPFESDEAEHGWAESRLQTWLDGLAQNALTVSGTPFTAEEESQVIRAVIDRVYGLGALDPMLRNPEVTDIHIMGADHCMMRMRDGSWVSAGRVARDDKELIRLIQTIAARFGGNIERRFDSLNPELNMQLRDGSRLFALRDVVERPQAVIRKHSDEFSSLAQLVRTGMVSPAGAHFLEHMVKGRLNCVVVGATGSGKTTLLRALCAEMPPHEHKVTIEEAKEIGLDRDRTRHPLCRALETRPADMQGNGEVTPQQLVRASLRMDPDRIILGEVRGGEALQMLLAMTQGQKGSLCTMHGESAVIAYPRLQWYVKMGGVQVPDEDVARFIVDAVHFVVFIAKVPSPDGVTYQRVIEEVVETRTSNGTQVTSNVVMKRNEDGVLVPMMKPSERTMGPLLRAGFNFERWWQSHEGQVGSGDAAARLNGAAGAGYAAVARGGR